MIVNKEIDHGKPFDWGRASEDYAKYRDIYPEEFYQRIVDLGLCVSGQSVLDLGTGTGVLPRNMYKFGASFTGADISENQIAYARLLSREAGMDIGYVVASAEMIDFPPENFDVVTACQCFFYFNKAVALPIIHGVLKDGGHLCVLFMAWLPGESEIAGESERLVLKYNPGWTGAGMQREEPVAPAEAEGLFEVEHAFGYDLDVLFTRESWHGRIKACRGIGASSLTDGEIVSFELEHLDFLSGVPDTFTIPHHATILNLRKRT